MLPTLLTLTQKHTAVAAANGERAGILKQLRIVGGMTLRPEAQHDTCNRGLLIRHD